MARFGRTEIPFPTIFAELILRLRQPRHRRRI